MADRYWVGGTGTWDNTSTTNWSATSGGASGASAPTSVDNVFFDANSNVGTGTFTVTTGGTTPACNNFLASGLDGTMTLTVSVALSVYGNFTAQATNFAVTSGTVAIQFVGSGTQTITSNGVTLTSISIGSPTAFPTVELADALNLGARNILVVAGTFDTKGYNVTCGSVSIPGTSAYTKTIKLNNSTVTLSGVINFANRNNFTFDAGTSSIVFTGAIGNIQQYYGPPCTFYNVSFTSAAVTNMSLLLSPSVTTFNNLSFPAATTTSYGIFVSGNIKVNGTLTLPTGGSYINRVWFYSFAGTTIDAAAISGTLTDVDFRGITVTGPTAPWTGTRLGDGGGNSGITGFEAPKTVYWSQAAGGNWSATAWATSSGGTPAVANYPILGDTVIFDNAGLNTSATVTADRSFAVNNVDFSARSTAMTFTANVGFVASNGNFTASSSVTFSGAAALYVGGWSGTSTLTSATRTFSNGLRCSAGPNATLIFADNYTSSTQLQFYSGNVDLNGKTFAISTLASLIAVNAVINLSGSTFNISGTSPLQFLVGNGGFGYKTFTGTCTFNCSSASAKTVNNSAMVDLSGFTFVNTGAGALSFSNIVVPGFNDGQYGIYGDIQTTVLPATINFGDAQTFQFNNFTISGTSGNLVTLQSNLAGTRANLIKTFGSVDVSYCSIKDLNVYGGSEWISLTTNGNVNAGNNKGWEFDDTGKKRITNEAPTFYDQFGDPLAGGTLSAYLSGTSEETFIYSNSDGDIAGTSITLNSNGQFATGGIWIDPLKIYKFVLNDSNGSQLWEIDNVTSCSGCPITIATENYFSSVLDSLNKSTAIEITDNFTANIITAGAVGWRTVRGNTAKDRSKWYFEVRNDVNADNGTIGYLVVGIGTFGASLTSDFIGNQPAAAFFTNVGFTANNPVNRQVYFDNGSPTTVSVPVAAAGSYIMVAVDASLGKVWFGVDGTWSGDPVVGTGEAATLIAFAGYGFYPYFSLYNADNTQTFTVNFGAEPFQYSIPGGFYRWDALLGSASSVDGDYLSAGQLAISPGTDNLQVYKTYFAATAPYAGFATKANFSGKKYFEVTNTVAGTYNGATYENWQWAVGVNAMLSNPTLYDGSYTMGQGADQIAYSNAVMSLTDGGTIVTGANFGSLYIPAAPAPQIPQGGFLGVAVDFDAGKIWFNRNGSWALSGDPVAGTNPITTFTPNLTMFPGYSLVYSGSSLFNTTITFNFGSTDFVDLPAGFVGWDDAGTDVVYGLYSRITPQFFDNDGMPLANGSIDVYLAGTATPGVAYSDKDGALYGTTISLDDRGEPAIAKAIWLNQALEYDFVVKDVDGNTVYTETNVTTCTTCNS